MNNSNHRIVEFSEFAESRIKGYSDSTRSKVIGLITHAAKNCRKWRRGSESSPFRRIVVDSDVLIVDIRVDVGKDRSEHVLAWLNWKPDGSWDPNLPLCLVTSVFGPVQGPLTAITLADHLTTTVVMLKARGLVEGACPTEIVQSAHIEFGPEP